ncbi:Transcription factor spt8 [Zancudomyces culisetae]|uniref:Transcription factor spt8 n=1 Tax=Zancudomyces culisetae TaxID=1213189 RepID=A0A1R1PK30_ZANCU|nr:Transcription factor spt8 [Zancudomyces culisetae]|eukprot:OMH81330.1 Transcription factor spt8 [Zancudomyces culisetae]
MSGNIGFWSTRHDEGRRLQTLKRHKAPVSVLKLSLDGYGLISGSWDRTVNYWDLNTGGVARTFEGHISQLSSGEFQPNNSAAPVLLTTSVDGMSLLWDIRDKTKIPRRLLPPERTPPWALSSCWGTDGNMMYVGRRNSTIDEFDFRSGSLVRTLKLPLNSGPVSQVCALANGKNLISSSYDNLRMWNLNVNQTGEKKTGGIPFQIIPGHHGATISQLYLDESGRFLVSAVGNRGWEGGGTNCCLFYEILPL